MSNFTLSFAGLCCCLCLVSCAATGYDAAYDCEQSIECLGEVTFGTQEQCVANTNAWLDDLNEESHELLDEMFLECYGQTSCNFITCMTGQVGDDDDSAGP